MILLTGATHPVGCVAPKVVSVAVQVTIVQLFSLVAHTDFAVGKVVGGKVTQAVVSGVLKDNVA